MFGRVVIGKFVEDDLLVAVEAADLSLVTNGLVDLDASTIGSLEVALGVAALDLQRQAFF